jgi:hypothetical protein
LVLNSFFPVETEAKGDCFYQAISIALTGNGSLSTAIRFATVAKIIENRVPLKTRVMRRFDERIKLFTQVNMYSNLKILLFLLGYLDHFTNSTLMK